MKITEVTNCKYGEYYCSTDKKVKCRKSPKKSRTVSEDGKIVPGVNTTQDVKPGETQRQAAKFGNKVDKDGRPPELHAKARRNSDPNTLYNLGLAEADDGSKMNPVAKNMNKFNKPATYKDRKKSLKRGDAPKHKGKDYEDK